MKDEIIEMFNHINAADFIVANPNSSTCDKSFKKLFNNTNFLDEFYVVSNRTFERLAEIAYVSSDITKNTVFITGYRGCGKTCFMHFLDKIIQNEYVLKDYNEYLKLNSELVKDVYRNQRTITNSYFYGEEQDEIEHLKNDYSKSLNRINIDLAAQLRIFYKGKEEENSISDYLNSCLNGKSIYLNFETGINSDSIPFNTKFIKQIGYIINDIIEVKDVDNNPFTVLYDLYQSNMNAFDKTFEYNNSIFEFMKYMENDLIPAKRAIDIRVDLDKKLNNMTLEQLIMLLVLLYISNEICFEEDENKYSKIFILLDNMDIIYQQTLSEQTMHSYSYFIENMNTLMETLSDKGVRQWYKIYDKITFIFAMRETTAMQFSDHFKDGMEQNILYFDMSMDTNKSLIVERKYQYINEYRDKIDNKVMLRVFQDVYRICTDYYTKENIFPMFNNDFKRAINCIAKICEENEHILAEHNNLNKINKHFIKNGSRGIIYRLIYNKFKTEHYFEKIGIEPYHSQFTPSRIILTLLYNFLPDDENEDAERLMPENINMKTIFSYARLVQDMEMFINAIIGMFSLKNEKMWNHLMTFDNVKDVSYDGLKQYVLSYIENRAVVSDISLRITDAGKSYIKEICTHFEFFSCRFCEQSFPLFCEENFVYIEAEDKYAFEKIIEDVFVAVKKCCNKLKDSYNQKVKEKYKSTPNKSLLTSKYVFRNKTEELGILHEERVIHKHITYIDNFRLYLIQYYYPEEKCKEINKRIIRLLKKYIYLMSDRDMSYRSRKLKDACFDCINYIVNVKDYDDRETEISEKSSIELRNAK